jgi:hypothetical protein
MSHWSDGSPRSQHTVFNWQPIRDRAKEEADEIRRAKDRARKRKGAEKSAAQLAMARATRVNPQSNIAYATGPTKSERAPR